MIDVQVNELRQLLIRSFRYSLTRKTGDSIICAKLLEKYWDILEDWEKRQIKRDIEQAKKESKVIEDYDVMACNAILELD